MKSREIAYLLMSAVGLLAGAVSLNAASPPYNETINYTYDARGRLTNVTHSGSVNNNLQANYTYDKAENRATVNVTGSPN